jgi:hypothetical protein
MPLAPARAEAAQVKSQVAGKRVGVPRRLIGESHEVRFGDRPPTKGQHDGEKTCIRTDTRAAEGVDGGASDGRSQLVRLAARLIIEDAREAADALGRGVFARGAASEPGCRNGDRTGRLKSAEGPIA